MESADAVNLSSSAGEEHMGAMPAGPSVTVADLHLRRGTRQVLAGASLAVARGEVVALMGASGSGKTTLLRVLAGLEVFEQGKVDVEGAAVEASPTGEAFGGLAKLRVRRERFLNERIALGGCRPRRRAHRHDRGGQREADSLGERHACDCEVPGGGDRALAHVGQVHDDREDIRLGHKADFAPDASALAIAFGCRHSGVRGSDGRLELQHTHERLRRRLRP